MNDLLDRITINPEIFSGKPIIRGRRLAVEHVLDMLAAGDDVLVVASWDERTLRARWATRNVDIHGNHTVHAFDDMVAMLPVGSATVGAAAHRNHVAGLRHLFIEASHAVGHFECHRP